MDSNHRRRKPADLQSAPVGHLGNLPAQSSRKRSAIKPNDNARLKFKVAELRLSLRIEGVAQTVADKVHREQGQHQSGRWKDHEPPVNLDWIDLPGAFRDERSPTGHGWLDAQPQIAQER